MRHLTLVAMLLILLFSCRKDIDVTQLKTEAVSSATQKGKRIYFTNPGNYISGKFNYSPGDTFVLKASIHYTYFTVSDVHDVTIINQGGVVKLQNGFNFTNCKNIKVTGTGSKERYGFEIRGHTDGDVGINITGKSAHITCNNIYIHDKTYGYWVKQEVSGTCDAGLYYPNWYMDDINIYNCMIKRMSQEGMYLGSTGQNADRVNGCGKYPYPMRLSNISVHDNIVDSTGRGGIMLSGADKGTNKIYNNTVRRCGFEFNSYQGNGIVIGGNAYATIHDNTISNTLCDGIWVLGIGTTYVMRNNISNSGYLKSRHANNMHGIAFDTRPSYPFRLSTFHHKKQYDQQAHRCCRYLCL
jgi:parallel beta-helix repeat protein